MSGNVSKPSFVDLSNKSKSLSQMESDLESIVGKDPLKEIKKMSPSSKVAALRKISEQMPNGPELAILQSHIVNLMSEQRSSLDFAVPIVPPNKYDVLILDITPEDLSRIGEELGSQALSVASVSPTFPVRGILFGLSHRMFVPLIVSKREKAINVNFLFDTGSPNTYLRAETLACLGMFRQENIPSETNVLIHGTSTTVYLSSNHFENVDLLGQDYFAKIRGLVTIDYPLQCLEVNTK
jgi:hypothetical protein